MNNATFKIILVSEPSPIMGYKHLRAVIKNDQRIPSEGTGAWGSSSIILVIPQDVDPRPASTMLYDPADGLLVNASQQIRNFRSDMFDLHIQGVNLPYPDVPIQDGNSYSSVGLKDDGFAYIPLMGQEPAASDVAYQPGERTLFEMDIPEQWADKITIAPFEIKEGTLMDLGIGWGVLANFIPTANSADIYNAIVV